MNICKERVISVKKVLLPEAGENMKYYRANLHCHSTVSDGRKTPEELKRDYKARGYSILSITDHNVLIPHNDMSDDSFLMLNGFETDVSADGKTCHLCFVSLDRDNVCQPCYHRDKYVWGNAEFYRDAVKFDGSKPDFEREYSSEGVNRMIKEGRDNGFFVTYNHPTWSLESYPEYSGYSGASAMEIVNFSCLVSGFDDDNGHCYEDMLRGGEKLFCIAADDNHNANDDGHPSCDSYGGYIMVASPSLSYEDVAQALRSGMFYAVRGSCTEEGPEFLGITFEDGKVRVKTSGVRTIAYMPSERNCHAQHAAAGGLLHEAEFEVGAGDSWFRFVITDAKGYKAYSNAYFKGDLT